MNYGTLKLNELTHKQFCDLWLFATKQDTTILNNK